MSRLDHQTATAPLRITFALPGAGSNPVGGFKVVYEYANHLAARGHQVTILHPALLLNEAPLLTRAIAAGRYRYGKVISPPLPPRWFPVDARVSLRWVPSLAQRFFPEADIVIATAWQTAEWVAALPASRGCGFYLIQHREDWHGFSERAEATWRLPLRKLVIANWLREMLAAVGESSTYLPNGLDHEAFFTTTPPEQRGNLHVMMLLHEADNKGSADGLAALAMAREAFPEMEVTLFGTPRPRLAPSWARYFQRPAQQHLRELYNQATVFVAPSRSEGWGLPPCEAMMCSAALVATDVGGHREFAHHGTTALLSPPEQPRQLANNLITLFSDRALRIQLARQGNEAVHQFSWPRSVAMLESAMSAAISRQDASNV